MVKVSCDFDDLVVWQTPIPGIKHALLPSSDTRPNPAVDDSRIYVSLFAPGGVAAFDRERGALLWRRRIAGLAAASVHLYKRKLFAKSSNTLYCFDAATGRPAWSFCPYGVEHETIYSAPTAAEGRVFIGDRRGFLHCLDAENGRKVWRVSTNRAGADVNTTPFLKDETVIIANNACAALAYSLDGRKIWETRLDGPSTLAPFAFRGSVGVAAASLYLLDPRDGRIVQKHSWLGDSVQSVCHTPRRIFIFLRGCWPPRGGAHLMVIGPSRVLQRYRVGFCLESRFADDTHLIYESHLDGINISNPSNGHVVCEIRTRNPGGLGQVEVKDGIIYALTQKGILCALRHPQIL